MKEKFSPLQHVIYVVIVVVVLTLVFGRSWGNNMAAFYFVCMLLPIVLGTSFFFNYLLVPKFLLKGRYLRFGLYSFYTAVVSIYLEMIVLMFSFIYFGNFNFRNLGPNARDTILLAVILYLLVLVGMLFLMLRQIRDNRMEIQRLMADREKMTDPFLELMSNRKLVRIPYKDIIFIESLSDYIQVNTIGEPIVSKEKISNLAGELPDTFIRIHRSFIINKEKIRSLSYDEVMVGDVRLTIGRSYRKAVKDSLRVVSQQIPRISTDE